MTTYNTGDLVSIMSTAFAAQSNENVRDDQGEPLGDIWGAVELCLLVFSLNILYTNNKSRLQTSGNVSGSSPQNEYSPDVDSFVNVFNIFRDPATESIGTVNFTPASASTTDQYIDPGTIVQTSDGLQFTVVADSTQGSYTASGYLIPSNSTAIVPVTVQCTTAGSIGNVSANTITSLVSGLGSTTPLSAYTVTNPQIFTNGTNGETDGSVYARFVNEFRSGRYATRLAVLTAIAGVQSNLTYQIIEAYNGATSAPGWFTVYVNVSGSGTTAPQGLIDAVTAAVTTVKALGISFVVLSPVLQAVPVAATIIADPAWLLIPGNTKALLQTNVQAAYDAYVNSIGLSSTNTTTLLSAAKVSAVLVSVPGVQNISDYTLNGANVDLNAATGHQFIAGTATLTVA